MNRTHGKCKGQGQGHGQANNLDLPLEIRVSSKSDFDPTNGVGSEIIIVHFVGFADQGSEECNAR